MMEGDLHSQPGVFVFVSGFVDAKGSLGIMILGRVDLQGGNSRPPWKSPPGAAAKVASVEVGSSM